MRLRTALALLAMLVAVGCNRIERPLVIGAKDFAEQQVVAEIVAQKLRARGVPAEVDPTRRDSLAAIEALWRGEIDLYVDYTGSVLALIGHPPIHDVDASFTTTCDLAAEYELAFGPLLGFRNDFVVLARPGSAYAASPATLSDLAGRARPLRVGMPADFRERPVDGFDALARRYGWRAEPSLVVASSPTGKDELYAALLDGEIDLAVGFRTDPEIADFGLVVLEDDRGFFPAYAAAPLTRAALLARRPELAAALDGLEDVVTTDEMRGMVAEVANLGADPFAVAATFLDPTGAPAPVGTSGRPLPIAVGDLDARAGQSAEVVLALRRAFPGRRIDIRRGPDPLAFLLADEVRYALVSGPAFFALDEAGGTRPRGAVDAIVPVGFDVVHLLVRADAPALDREGGLRLGVGAPDGVTARTATLMAAGLPGTELTLVEASEGGGLRAQADAVRRGDLDGLLIMAEAGHPLVAELLAGGLDLAPLDLWEARGNRVAFPFLQPVTIPAATYVGQREPVASVGSQVVLAAARPDPGDAVGIVGPGSAAIRETLPIGARTVARIRDALEVEVRLDPSLPLALAARRPPPERPTTIATSPAGSLVTLAVIVALVLIGRLYVRPARRAAPGDEAREQERAGRGR
ncbi:MAG: hypothetical protein GVY33_10505 [Alphaproteobacteria bacterium]|jgi:glycine betaine/choline ABC-type transport system substrate-binding protein|nr:hypothetical protein [Alphaproteobacteria bacterium]